MNPLSFEYRISLREYHTALYYGLVTRYHTATRIFVAVTVAAIFCYLGALIGLFPYFALPAYIFLGYLVCVCFLLARVEHGVLKMLKDPKNPLQNQLKLEFVRDQLKVETPHNGEKHTHRLEKLFLVFELSNVFLLYLDPMNTIILPTRVMSPAERSELRERLREALHDRLQSRFSQILKAPKMRPLTGKKGLF